MRPPVKPPAGLFERAPERCQLVELRAEHRRENRVGDPRVERVHDRGRRGGVHLAVEVAVQAARALRAPLVEQREHLRVARVGARARRPAPGRSPATWTTRKSCVAAVFIAPRSPTPGRASAAWRGPPFSICTRCDRAVASTRRRRSRSPGAGLLFQLTSMPVGGFGLRAGARSADRKPFHSYSPVPLVGQARVHARVAQRQQAGRVGRDVLSSA